MSELEFEKDPEAGHPGLSCGALIGVAGVSQGGSGLKTTQSAPKWGITKE